MCCTKKNCHSTHNCMHLFTVCSKFCQHIYEIIISSYTKFKCCCIECICQDSEIIIYAVNKYCTIYLILIFFHLNKMKMLSVCTRSDTVHVGKKYYLFTECLSRRFIHFLRFFAFIRLQFVHKFAVDAIFHTPHRIAERTLFYSLIQFNSRNCIMNKYVYFSFACDFFLITIDCCILFSYLTVELPQKLELESELFLHEQ